MSRSAHILLLYKLKIISRRKKIVYFYGHGVAVLNVDIFTKLIFVFCLIIDV